MPHHLGPAGLGSLARPGPMRLPAEEPAAGPWRVAPFGELVGTVLSSVAVTDARPRVVAVDGRSASGKTTLASRLRAAVAGAAVVHTDDVAWHHSFFDWADLLLTGVLEPVHRGEPVTFRPPAWVERGRAGAVAVPSSSSLVVLEGVGAARRELRPWLDAVVWVQADVEVAERRGIARDGGNAAAADFWREWAGEEVPFLARHRPWEEAVVVVAGTPSLPHDPSTEVVVAPPLGVGAGSTSSGGDLATT